MKDTLTIYSLDEVAEMLQLTKRTLYSYVKQGKLKAVKIGKYWRVTKENLEEFIASNQSGAYTSN